MKYTSWFFRGNGSCRGRNRNPRPPTSCRARTPLLLEPLEDRTVPSIDGLPAISGASSINEANLYTLQLDPGNSSLAQWTIDWGDGTVETVAGNAESASHLYEDGPNTFTITATASQNVNLNLFQWVAEAGGNDHFYGVTSAKTNWLVAEDEAVSLGGYLASITSQQEQDFIVGAFLSGTQHRNVYWFGLNDIAVEGTYVWTTGEEVDYTNFEPGEPNNFRGVEDYGMINWHYGHNIAGSKKGTWNDGPVNGFNGNASAPELNKGLMEFDTHPVSEVAVLTLDVTVENVAPTASVSGPDLGVRGQTLTFTLDATDPSAADQSVGFTFSIDWDGDGTVDQVVEGASGTTVEHTFADKGTFVVHVTATDRDGGVSVAAVHSVTIKAAALVPDSSDPSRSVLMVAGTGGNDRIRIVKHRRSDTVRVWINGQFEGAFALPDSVVVHGHEGNDRILVRGVDAQLDLHGDAGRDVVIVCQGQKRGQRRVEVSVNLEASDLIFTIAARGNGQCGCLPGWVRGMARRWLR